MNIIKRDVAWGSRLDLPYSPIHLIESNCPKCGELAISNGIEEYRLADLNMGNSDLPTAISFYCYGPYEAGEDREDCDTEWKEYVVLRLSVEPYTGPLLPEEA